MAEHVYQNLEDMLPELEDLERHGIFNRGEIRMIVKKRTNFEYKLQRRVVEKDDFLKYLQYEFNVDTLRRKRMQRLGLKKRYAAAEIGITKRMHYIFQKALKKFGGSTVSLGRAFARLTQIHPQNPNVWIIAAKWEFEDNSSIDNARNSLRKYIESTALMVLPALTWSLEVFSGTKLTSEGEIKRSLMQRALRINPESKILWLEKGNPSMRFSDLPLLHIDNTKYEFVAVF